MKLQIHLYRSILKLGFNLYFEGERVHRFIEIGCSEFDFSDTLLKNDLTKKPKYRPYYLNFMCVKQSIVFNTNLIFHCELRKYQYLTFDEQTQLHEITNLIHFLCTYVWEAEYRLLVKFHQNLLHLIANSLFKQPKCKNTKETQKNKVIHPHNSSKTVIAEYMKYPITKLEKLNSQVKKGFSLMSIDLVSYVY